jgi:hypothetical protein
MSLFSPEPFATLLHEENLISLRTAVVLDDGHVVTFSLSPRWLTTSLPGPRDYAKSDSTYLYRRRRSFYARMALAPLGGTQKKLFGWTLSSGKRRGFWRWAGHVGYRRLVISLEDDIRVMPLAHPPKLKLLWTDSGHSVALYLDGQPWAFIHEEKNHGYSKGILKPTIGNTWDQELFEQTFTSK